MSQNVSSLNCNCTYCKSDASTTTTLNAAAAAAPTAKRKSPFNYSTDRALLRLADRVARRVEPIREYFRPSYMARKGRSYLEACAAAESALSGEFAEGSKIRHYSGYSIKPYNFAEYQGRENKVRLENLLLASGSEGKKAFLEHKPLSVVSPFTFRAAQIPTNREAREYFADKDFAIAVTKRSTDKVKDKPYFLHYSKESVVKGADYVILPIESKVSRRWSTKRASEEQKDMRPTTTQQIN